MIKVGRLWDATGAISYLPPILIGSLPKARLNDFLRRFPMSPTATTFMTGRYTARHRLWHVLPWYGYPRARAAVAAENYLEIRSPSPKDSNRPDIGPRSSESGISLAMKTQLQGLNPEAAQTTASTTLLPLLLDPISKKAAIGVSIFSTIKQSSSFPNKENPWFVFCLTMIHGVVVAPESLTEKYQLDTVTKDSNRAVYLAS